MMFVYFMDVNLIHLFVSFIYFISSYFILFMYFGYRCYFPIIDNLL